MKINYKEIKHAFVWEGAEIIGNTHCLCDRGRSPPCLVYSEGENIDCPWVQLSAEHSQSTAVTPNRLLFKIRLCGVLQIQTHKC